VPPDTHAGFLTTIKPMARVRSRLHQLFPHQIDSRRTVQSRIAVRFLGPDRATVSILGNCSRRYSDFKNASTSSWLPAVMK
jgi:hypothetical protein